MRITADIIDEEIDKDPSFANNDIPAATSAKFIKTKVNNDIPMKSYMPEYWIRKCRLKNEMKMRDKCRSNWYQKMSGDSHRKTHALGMQDLNYKFQNLKLSTESDSLEKIKESCEYAQRACLSDYKMDEAKAKSSNSQETPPAWMTEMLIKVKQEIKDEILEELYGYSQLELYEMSSTVKKNEKTTQDEVIHHGVFCDNCDQNIRGIRYKCGNCFDFDLCTECESLPNIHNKNHIFLKIRYPVAFTGMCQDSKNKSFMPCPKSLLLSSNKSVGHHHRRYLYDAKYLCDETIADGTVLAPSTRFVKSWKVVNSGKRVWTHATKLRLIKGSADFTPDSEQVDVPHLRPGEEGIVSVWFSTPSIPGVYECCWNFCHKNCLFGHAIWFHIIVADVQPEKLVETLQLPPDGLPDSKEQEVVTITQVLTAVKEEHDRGNMIPRKLAVKSHTATPTNTPFDLTPPKSPDHAVCELKEVAELREPTSSKTDEYIEAEDEDSVVSLSSSESDAEFVVIPMPKCFDLSESISSQHISHLSQYLPPETVVNIKDLSAPEHKMATSQKIVNKSATFSAETVSQETGVPEFSSQAETEQKILISHSVSADGSSSSEVSVLESGSNSPTGEQAIPEIHVAITSEIEGKNPVVTNDANDLKDENKAQNSTDENPPSSTTFPKFPVEGITTIYEPMSNDKSEQSEEQNGVALSQKLTAPIDAAVNLFNTARGVLSSLQYPARSNPGAVTVMDPMDQLKEMGFCNRDQNAELLKKHKNDVALVVAELVSMNDNDWYASRHVHPSP